ncbi:DUF3592 domain-containing protein [Ferruginibacter sp.]
MMKMNTGAWIGIIGGILGGAIGIACVIAFAGSIGLYIAAGMILLFVGMGYLFYKLLFQQMILAARLQKVGIPAKALIKDIQDTNVTINNNPQIKLVLELKNSFGQTYAAAVRTVISRFQPLMYQIGMTVPVLVDPADENKMVLDTTARATNTATTSFAAKNVSALGQDMMKEQQEGDSIRLMGRAAKAIIKKYTWLGIYVNGNNPYSEMVLEVLPADAPAFEATVKAAIAEQSVSKYQPGQEIFVKYDTMDNKKVAIEHS